MKVVKYVLVVLIALVMTTAFLIPSDNLKATSNSEINFELKPNMNEKITTVDENGEPVEIVIEELKQRQLRHFASPSIGGPRYSVLSISRSTRRVRMGYTIKIDFKLNKIVGAWGEWYRNVDGEIKFDPRLTRTKSGYVTYRLHIEKNDRSDSATLSTYYKKGRGTITTFISP